MTYGRRQFEHLDVTMRRLIPPFHAAVAELTAMVDADARAFEAYLVRVQAGCRHWPYGAGPEGQWGQWTVMGGSPEERKVVQGHGGEGETAISTDVWRPGGLEGGDSGLAALGLSPAGLVQV